MPAVPLQAPAPLKTNDYRKSISQANGAQQSAVPHFTIEYYIMGFLSCRSSFSSFFGYYFAIKISIVGLIKEDAMTLMPKELDTAIPTPITFQFCGERYSATIGRWLCSEFCEIVLFQRFTKANAAISSLERKLRVGGITGILSDKTSPISFKLTFEIVALSSSCT